MEYLAKLLLNFSFEYKHMDESRDDFFKRIIEEAKEHIAYYHADVLEISGEMFISDILCFKKLLNTEPLSGISTDEPHKYWVTFVIPSSELLKEDSSETSV